MRPQISPASTSNDTPSSATIPPKRTDTSRTRRIGSLATAKASRALSFWPDLARDIAHKPQFRFLLRVGHRVGVFTGGEAALRRQCNPFQRHEFRGLVDACLNGRRIFQRAVLCCDQPKNDRRVLPDVLERREVAGARRIV